MPDSANYPDVLGLITGGSRVNIGVAQVAVAVRPRINHAGRPFEVILLVQNASDGAIDVSMSLHLPPVDAKKQRDRFIGKTQRLVVEVKGAEVGTIVLPVTTSADTAVSDTYKIGVEVDVKPLGKASRIRASEGRGEIVLDALSHERRIAIEALKPLTFSTSKHRGGNIIDVPLTILSGGVGKMTDFTPGWVSVCKVADYNDSRLLLHYYGPTIQVNTLPKLKRGQMFPPLLETTKNRFSEAGYPLTEGESQTIAKLMALVLEYAAPRANGHGSIVAGTFDVEGLLMRDPFTFEAPPVLPYWLRGFTDLLERDERAATHPAQVIPRYLYEDLLRDAVNFGFELVTEATGEDLGSREEQEMHREELLTLLKEKAGLDFNRVYLPLIMGGLLINDQFSIAKENPADLLREVGLALESRLGELGEADRAVYSITKTVLARVGQRYGFYVGE